MINIKSRYLMLVVAIAIVILLAYPAFYTRTESAETLNQQGGGEVSTDQFFIVDNMVCFPIPTPRVEYVIVTATPSPTESTTRTPTLAPSATLTLTPPAPTLIMPSGTPRPPNTPTPATPAVERTATAISAKCNQPGAEHAVSAAGVYAVTGLWQYVRTYPDATPLADNRVGSFQNGTVKEVFWKAYDDRGVLWVSYVRECNRWLSTTLGIFTEEN